MIIKIATRHSKSANAYASPMPRINVRSSSVSIKTAKVKNEWRNMNASRNIETRKQGVVKEN